MKVRYEREIRATAKQCLQAYRNTDFYSEKQKSSGALTVEILETEDLSDGGWRMLAKVSEPSRMPSFLRQGDVDTYVDDSRIDPAAGTVSWKITPDFGADKFFLSGEIEFHDRGATTLAVYNVQLQVKIPLVGKKAEKLGLASTESETDKQAAFLQRWVDSQ